MKNSRVDTFESDISPVFSVHDLYPGPGYGEVRGSLEAGQGRVRGEAVLVIRALEAGDKQPGPDQRREDHIVSALASRL